MAKHLAAVAAQAGEALSVVERDTPSPGLNEILIQVQALAINPVDYYQRDYGMPPVPVYPAVFGSDVAGTVAALGSGVSSSAPQVGSRVLALATAFYEGGQPDYGAFQQYVLAKQECVITLPEKISFEEGAAMPLAMMTALTAYTTVGIPLTTKYTAEDKQGIIVWGAASSVGTFAVQSAKSLGFIVYATASEKNHEYIKKLGADHVFDYADSDVVSKLVEAMKKDGVKMQTAHVVVIGGLQPTLDVLKATKDDTITALVSHSPLLPEDHPKLVNTEIKFNFPSTDKDIQAAHFKDSFAWLVEGLEAGTVVSSPPVEVVGKGLESVNKALDTVRAGVSCKKIVVTL